MTPPNKDSIIQSLTRVSISKNLEKKWLNNFSLARENWIFSSLSCLDFQDVEKKILFLFSIYEICCTILFLFTIFKIFKKNSLSLLDLWDFETRFSFSSRIFKILREQISFSSWLMRFLKWFSFSSRFLRFLEIIQRILGILNQRKNRVAHKCNQCGLTSSWAGHFSAHLHIHVGEKSSKCNQCDYAFSYASNFEDPF